MHQQFKTCFNQPPSSDFQGDSTPRRPLTMLFLAALLAPLLSLAPIDHTQAASPDYKPKPDPVPGGVAVVELPVSIGTDQEPVAYFMGKRVHVVNRPYSKKSDNRWIAWVGIPLELREGKHPLTIEQPNGRNRDIMINVRPPKHSTKHLVSRNPQKLTPGSTIRRQIEDEKNTLMDVIRDWNPSEPDQRVFLHPTRGKLLNGFGDQVFLNGKLISSHNGIDLSGPRAAAPADGTIVLIRDFYYNGKTVVIDHGRGLFTQYSHLEKTSFRIREGQRIRRGEEIGKVGLTGHHIIPGKDHSAPIQQAHLHWAVSLNGVFVDPGLFLINSEIR